MKGEEQEDEEEEKQMDRARGLRPYGDLHAPSGPVSRLPKITANNMRALFTVFPVMYYRLNNSAELNRGLSR